MEKSLRLAVRLSIRRGPSRRSFGFEVATKRSIDSSSRTKPLPNHEPANCRRDLSEQCLRMESSSCPSLIPCLPAAPIDSNLMKERYCFVGQSTDRPPVDLLMATTQRNQRFPAWLAATETMLVDLSMLAGLAAASSSYREPVLRQGEAVPFDPPESKNYLQTQRSPMDPLGSSESAARHGIRCSKRWPVLPTKSNAKGKLADSRGGPPLAP